VILLFTQDRQVKSHVDGVSLRGHIASRQGVGLALQMDVPTVGGVLLARRHGEKTGTPFQPAV